MNITNPNGLFTDAGSIPAEPTIRFHGRIEPAVKALLGIVSFIGAGSIPAEPTICLHCRIEPAVKALFRYFCFTHIGSIQGLISHSL